MSHNLNQFFVFRWLLVPALILDGLTPTAVAQTPATAITDVGDFGVSNGTGQNNGINPRTGLVHDSANGLFYGTAEDGGANGDGDVFSFNPTTGAIKDVGDFNSTGGNGGGPNCTLVYDSANGLFYGTTQFGGANGIGDVFSFNPNDADPSTSMTDVGDIPIPSSGSYGSNPSALTYDGANGLFYGTAFSGGANGIGYVFTFNPSDADPATSITDVGDFIATTYSGTVFVTGGNGAEPVDALVYDSASGLFYGTASGGGANGEGDVFTFNPNASSASTSITDVGDFTATINSTTGLHVGGNGAQPDDALVYDSASGLFYGTASGGGADGSGDVFAFNPALPAASAITDVGDFTSTFNDVTDTSAGGNGDNPVDALVYDGANGLFYGTAYDGGAHGDGDVFSFNPTDANPSASIADVGDFTSPSSGSGGNGGNPADALIYDSASGLFYGTASGGGANGEGDVFSFTPIVTTTTGGGPTTPTALITLPSGALQMVCLDETYTNFAAALNGATPPAYDTYNDGYVLTNSAAEAAPGPGNGFWIDPSSPLTVDDTGTPASGTVTVPLHPGWNIIGDPFSTAFPLASVTVTGTDGQNQTGVANADVNDLLFGTLYTWGPSNTTAYTTMDGTASGASLQPFTGYWLYAFQSGETLTLTEAQ